MSLRPGLILPGSAFEAIVRLDARRATAVDAIEMRFWGESQNFYGESHNIPHRFVDLVATDRPKRLAAGPYEVRARFAVPATAPHSYKGTTLRTDYTLRVHVDIPWWPDRVSEFTIPVVAAPIRVEQESAVLRIHDRPGDVRAEVAIDRATLAPGAVLTGRVAFSRTRESGLGHCKLRLRCIESTVYGQHDGVNYVLELPITRHVDGRALTFRMRIPEGASPALNSAVGTTRWQLDLDVTTRGVERTLVSFALQVVGAGSEGVDLPTELPLIGEQWLGEMMARVARQCGMHFDASSQRLIGDVEGLALDVGQSQSGSTEARVRWPRLGLGLRVGQARWQDALAPEEIELDHKPFDDKYQLRGRERAQVVALLALPPEVLDYLAQAESLTADDHGMTLTVADVSTREESFTRFVRIAQAVTATLRQRINSVPPSAVVSANVDGWRALAARYSARLCTGDGAIERAELGTERLNLAHEFKAEHAVATRIEAALDPPLPSPPSPDDARTIRAEHKDKLDALVAAGGRWRCTDTTLTVTVEPLRDPDEADRWLNRVASASRAIQGRRETGPFR